MIYRVKFEITEYHFIDANTSEEAEHKMITRIHEINGTAFPDRKATACLEVLVKTRRQQEMDTYLVNDEIERKLRTDKLNDAFNQYNNLKIKGGSSRVPRFIKDIAKNYRPELGCPFGGIALDSYKSYNVIKICFEQEKFIIDRKGFLDVLTFIAEQELKIASLQNSLAELSMRLERNNVAGSP